MTSAQDRIQQAALRLFGELDRPQVTVSELAEAAGVARGTIYNNVASLDSLFEDVATRLVTEMDTRVTAASAATSDPAQRIADGMRFFVRQAHEDPQWGRFLVQFGATTPTLRGLLEGAPRRDLLTGMERGNSSSAPTSSNPPLRRCRGQCSQPFGSSWRDTRHGGTRDRKPPSCAFGRSAFRSTVLALLPLANYPRSRGIAVAIHSGPPIASDSAEREDR